MRSRWRERAQLACWAQDHLHSQSVHSPDNWPEVSRLAVGEEVPLYCGDHAVGLTGVYSVVNAMKLIMAETTPIQPSEEGYLLELGWRFLGDRIAIMPSKGLRMSVVIRLAEAMLFAFGRRRHCRYGAPLSILRHSPRVRHKFS